jgi:hypothetical protein
MAEIVRMLALWIVGLKLVICGLRHQDDSPRSASCNAVTANGTKDTTKGRKCPMPMPYACLVVLRWQRLRWLALHERAGAN